LSHEFRRAIEEIKLRAPIEDVVREHVPSLKKAGAVWKACCPFHDEKTPSFVVDPRRGTWHCFGACAEGGDQIAFVERFSGLGFLDALEVLAARTGVDVPRGRGRGGERREADDPGYALLEGAARFYAERLAAPEGRAAREYLTGRGLSEATLADFGLGWAPAGGRELCGWARQGAAAGPAGGPGSSLDLLERCGLARRNESGHGYDFFRGRLVIPIRDERGRTVGFGARRLGEGDGPKYINTPETPYFKKGRLVYGFDKALAEARKARHLILVEGYTDVMAAHQVGLRRVGAVLGTSTGTDHAGLLRRCGARRIHLVFDGDEAGTLAARRALAGLLPLEVELSVVRLPIGEDPCDLLLREGAEAFLARIEAAPDWFEVLCGELEGRRGAELSQGVDELLELLQHVPRPVHRRSLVQELADRLGVGIETLREQWRSGARGRRRPAPATPPATAPEPSPDGEAPGEPEARVLQAFRGLVGAVLLDPSLVPLVRPLADECQDVGLSRILEVVLGMYEDLDAVIDPSSVLTVLGDHPARKQVAGLAEHAGRAASPKELLDGCLESLRRHHEGRRVDELKARFLVLEQRIREATDEVAQSAARSELERVANELTEVLRCGRTPEEEPSPTDGLPVHRVSPTART